MIRSTDYVIKNPAKKKMVGSMLISSKRFHLLRNDLTVVNKVVDVPSKDTKEYWDSDWGLLEVESVLLMVVREPSMVTGTMKYRIEAIEVKSVVIGKHNLEK